MRFDLKWTLFLVVLTLASAYLTFYTVKTHAVVSNHVFEGEGFDYPVWRTSPPGSLFPWPTEPGPLEALSKMNETDLIIYRYLVKSLVLVGSVIALWIITCLCLIKAMGKVRSVHRNA